MGSWRTFSLRGAARGGPSPVSGWSRKALGASARRARGPAAGAAAVRAVSAPPAARTAPAVPAAPRGGAAGEKHPAPREQLILLHDSSVAPPGSGAPQRHRCGGGNAPGQRSGHGRPRRRGHPRPRKPPPPPANAPGTGRPRPRRPPGRTSRPRPYRTSSVPDADLVRAGPRPGRRPGPVPSVAAGRRRGRRTRVRGGPPSGLRVPRSAEFAQRRYRGGRSHTLIARSRTLVSRRVRSGGATALRRGARGPRPGPGAELRVPIASGS